MKTFLARRWFVLAIVAGALLIWLYPEALQWATGVNPSLTGATAIFLTALGMESRTLGQALLRPAAALWAVVISFGLLPALALLLGHLQPHADFRIGLILIASVPCTLTSAVIWTRLAAGNEATALLVVLLTNLFGCLATTGWLMLGAGLREGGVDARDMITRLFLVLVLPVAIGQLLRLAAPVARAAGRHKLAMGVSARLLTLTIMFKAALAARERLSREGESVDALFLLVAARSLPRGPPRSPGRRILDRKVPSFRPAQPDRHRPGRQSENAPRGPHPVRRLLHRLSARGRLPGVFPRRPARRGYFHRRCARPPCAPGACAPGRRRPCVRWSDLTALPRTDMVGEVSGELWVVAFTTHH
jgi:sodium/bile acid cotransporter 7